uniref:Uncharacterized protein n=1 Tax=Monopterus albus TaxID=43700 RepID=A0A3Q3IH94_MONAL
NDDNIRKKSSLCQKKNFFWDYWNEMRPYGLRRCIRCPKKYGETIKERKYMLAPSQTLDCMNEHSEADPAKPLDERYIRNAAVLPDVELPMSTGQCGGPQHQPGLRIHGFTAAEYQQTYHSVVDPLLLSPCGTLAAYSLELGRNIKERLFKELAYPMLQISEYSDGKQPVYTVISGQWPKSMLKSWDNT